MGTPMEGWAIMSPKGDMLFISPHSEDQAWAQTEQMFSVIKGDLMLDGFYSIQVKMVVTQHSNR
jgi:hypothetical protein